MPFRGIMIGPGLVLCLTMLGGCGGDEPEARSAEGPTQAEASGAPAFAIVHVDSGFDRQLTVRVDGADAGTVPPLESIRLQLEPGEHHIEALDGDRVVDGVRQTVQAPDAKGAGGRYVFNVGAKVDYRVVAYAYTESHSVAFENFSRDGIQSNTTTSYRRLKPRAGDVIAGRRWIDVDFDVLGEEEPPEGKRNDRSEEIKLFRHVAPTADPALAADALRRRDSRRYWPESLPDAARALARDSQKTGGRTLLLGTLEQTVEAPLAAAAEAALQTMVGADDAPRLLALLRDGKRPLAVRAAAGRLLARLGAHETLADAAAALTYDERRRLVKALAKMDAPQRRATYLGLLRNGAGKDLVRLMDEMIQQRDFAEPGFVDDLLAAVEAGGAQEDVYAHLSDWVHKRDHVRGVTDPMKRSMYAFCLRQPLAKWQSRTVDHLRLKELFPDLVLEHYEALTERSRTDLIAHFSSGRSKSTGPHAVPYLLRGLVDPALAVRTEAFEGFQRSWDYLRNPVVRAAIEKAVAEDADPKLRADIGLWYKQTLPRVRTTNGK